MEPIEAALRDESSGLRDRIVRDIGNFTIALFGVFESKEGDRLLLGGTGTLVAAADSHYILTATYVWDKILKSARMVGITLKEDTDHRFLMEAKEIVPFGPAKPDTWDEWGPDLAFLRVPPERVGPITVYKTFYNLTRPRQTALDVDHIETWVLMGSPQALGQFTQTYADLQINGFFTQVEAPRQTRGEFDYLDFDVDVSFPGIPGDFGGVSGGSLWKVLVYRSASTGEIDWLRVLEGVAFHQSALAKWSSDHSLPRSAKHSRRHARSEATYLDASPARGSPLTGLYNALPVEVSLARDGKCRNLSSTITHDKRASVYLIQK